MTHVYVKSDAMQDLKVFTVLNCSCNEQHTNERIQNTKNSHCVVRQIFVFRQDSRNKLYHINKQQ